VASVSVPALAEAISMRAGHFLPLPDLGKMQRNQQRPVSSSRAVTEFASNDEWAKSLYRSQIGPHSPCKASRRNH
jgi:hypothetical protein